MGRIEESREFSAPSADADDADPDDDAPEVRHGRVPAEGHGERVDKALAALAPEFSRSHVQALVKAGHATLDGRVVASTSERVKAGQALALALVQPAQSRAFRAEALPLAVVHEDAHLAVLDKPAGLVVHPAAGHWSGTLLNGLLARWPASAALPRAGIVHRLDKDTSGLIVVAKTLEAMTALVRAIAAREVARRYLAICHGVAPAAPFTVDVPVGRDPRLRTRMAVTPGGKPARTGVERVAASAGADDGRGASALRCVLETGRTHQIRVHLASRGLPLVADRTYGGHAALGLERQALHAAQLAFKHPATGSSIDLVSDPPRDFAIAWSSVTDGPPSA